MESVLPLAYFSALLAVVSPAARLPVPSPAAPRSVTACAAVTRADVQDALGQPIAKSEEETDGVESTCDYAGAIGQVTILIRRFPERLNIPAEIAGIIKNVPNSKVRTAAGIGTHAFFVDIAGAGTQLHVMRGEHQYLMISLLGFGEGPHVSAAATKIARKALSRM